MDILPIKRVRYLLLYLKKSDEESLFKCNRLAAVGP